MTVPTAVHFCWTYHSTCPADHIDARSRGNLLAEFSSSRRWRNVVSAASDPTVASRAGANRLLRTKPQVRLANLFSYRTITGTSSLFHTQALPLVETRILRPRMSRELDAQQPRASHGPQPRTRLVHGCGLATGRAQLRNATGHGPATEMFSPRPQSRQQIVRVHDQATDRAGHGQATVSSSDCPRPVRGAGMSASANRLQSRLVQELASARPLTVHRLSVSSTQPTQFPLKSLMLAGMTSFDLMSFHKTFAQFPRGDRRISTLCTQSESRLFKRRHQN